MTATAGFSDSHWMQQALAQAELAMRLGEVPVGAVVVHRGQLVGAGHNAPISNSDPSAHAEIAALRAAAATLGNYRLQDCELFVTLEPCAMCAGAILHARIQRVVYGASDPKAGAAGSVTDLFALPALNHQTQVTGGLLADRCSGLLQDFFRHQRSQQRQQRSQPGRVLRDDALRTPESRFAQQPPMPAPSQYVSDLPSLAGLRLHYVDSGASTSSASCLCLHGPQDWCLVWRERMMHDASTTVRWVCPDLIGFGRSDKLKKTALHRLDWHAQVLLELIERLELQQITLLAPPSMQALAHLLAQLAARHIVQVSLVNTPELDALALQAPFPDRGHQAGLTAFARLLDNSAQSRPPTANTDPAS